MSNQTKPVVVHCDALSYSGTTWLNLCLGTHENGFAIGPPHRLQAKIDEGSFKGLCLVHGEDCDFWEGFGAQWDMSVNLFVALKAFSGKTHFFFDNPPPDFVETHMREDAVEVKRVRYVRDARAITASFVRKMADVNFYDSIQPNGWFYHSFMAIPVETPDTLYIRYEDAARDIKGTLAKVGAHIGLNYSGQSTRFWAADHHITSGNAGPINMVRLDQGLNMPNFESKDVYEAQYAKLVANPDDTYFDERWKRHLSREDLFHFDLLMGEKNAKLGYERDIFTDAEIKEIWERYGYEAHVGERKALPDTAMFEGQRRYNAAAARLAAAPVETAPLKADMAEPNMSETPVETPSVVAALAEEDIASAEEAAPQAATSEGLKGHADAVAYFRSLPDAKPRSLEDTATTKFFDEVDPARMAEMAPYTVEPSTWDDDYLKLAVNLNMFQAYGPAYADKTHKHIQMDPLLRYADVLRRLKRNPRIKFRTFADSLNNPPQGDEICVLIRHDLDGDLFAAIDMAEIENRLGVATSYYLLHNAPYYAVREDKTYKRNDAALPYYRRLQELGQEVGVHTDSLTLFQFEGIRGDEALTTEIGWLRENGIKVEGTLAHNHQSIYGVNNHAQFKLRPHNISQPSGPMAVEHNGNWSPLQQLDEVEMGLTYEGNDVFWQDHTPLFYCALMNQSLWFVREEYHNQLVDKTKRPYGFHNQFGMSTDDVIDAINELRGPIYVNMVYHPLSLGLRADYEAPSASHERAFGEDTLDIISGLKPIAQDGVFETVVEAEGREDVTVRWGVHEGEAEFIAMTCKNEEGQEDRPVAQMADGDLRLLTFGRSNFQGRGINVDSKISQLTCRLLRSRLYQQKQVLGTSFCAPNLSHTDIRKHLNALDSELGPHAIMVGLSREDLEDTSRGCAVDFLNRVRRRAAYVLGVVECSGSTQEEAMREHAEIAAGLRRRCSFQIIDPYDSFASYQGQGDLYFGSTGEWAYQAHYMAADLATRALQDVMWSRSGINPEWKLFH